MASSLSAIVAQRLVRKNCSHCAVQHEADEVQKSWFAEVDPDFDSSNLRKGAGCQRCGNSGYQGRIGVYELLVIDGEMAAALRNDDLQGFAKIASATEAFEPLWHSVLRYACQGVTTLDEAIRISGDTE